MDSLARSVDGEGILISRRAARRAALANLMVDNREGLGMKVIAVMVQRYGVLCRELWDLNRESDMGAGRKVVHNGVYPAAVYESIISNTRYNIVDLTITVELTVTPVLPNALQRLTLLWRDSSFPLVLPANLLELSFMWQSYVTQPLVLPETLQKLRLGGNFRHPVTFPPSLVSIYVGSYYHHPIPQLPPGLKEFEIYPDNRFNAPITLPLSLTRVLFNERNKQPQVLPDGIGEVGVGRNFSHDISFPASVRTISWGCNRPIQLHEGLIQVTFGQAFNKPLTFPSSLKAAIFLGELAYSHPITFPVGLEEIAWSRRYAGLLIPEGVRKLTWGTRIEADNIEFPVSLKELILSTPARVTLPEELEKFSFALTGSAHVDLPASVQHVTWFPESTFTHPTTLKHLTIGSGDGLADLSKYKIDKVTIDCTGTAKIEIKSLPRKLKELEFSDGTHSANIIGNIPLPRGCKVLDTRGQKFFPFSMSW